MGREERRNMPARSLMRVLPPGRVSDPPPCGHGHRSDPIEEAGGKRRRDAGKYVEDLMRDPQGVPLPNPQAERPGRRMWPGGRSS